MRPECFARGAPAARPACHMTANRMKSGTVSTRLSVLFLRPKPPNPLHQSAIDFLSETLLWFGAGGVAGMKICPKCQQQFPNGFQYCPNDTEHLIASEEYARRTKPTTSAPKIEPIERPPSIPIPPRSPEPSRARQTEPFRPELPRSEPVRPSQNALRPDPPSFPRPPAGPQPPAGYGGPPAPPVPRPPAGPQPPAGYGGTPAPPVPPQPSRPRPQAQPPIQSTPAAPN